MRKKLIIGLAAAFLIAGIAGGTAVLAGGGDDGEETASGAETDRAKDAALLITGGGKASAVERDNYQGATWEVEVTKTDGTTVDVYIDDNYKLVTTDGDTESPDDAGGEE